MSTRQQRIEVFEDTQSWIEEDPALSESLDYAKKHTEVFYEDDYPAYDASGTYSTEIAVTGDRSFQAAMRLAEENPGAKIAVMKRAIHMLTVAAAKKADILVLGAFGCGAFRNNPEEVASAYKTALSVFPKVFSKVEFAVYCAPGHPENYEVFKRVLGG